MSLHRHLPGERLSEAVVANGFIFTTQVPRDGTADARAQTLDVLEQTDQVLADLGSDKSKVVDVTIFLPDFADFAEMNAAWDSWVVPGHTPTRATVQAKLGDPSWKVEIKVIAVR